jgi:hypothetical protein
MKLGWDRWGEFRMPSRRFLVGMPGPPSETEIGNAFVFPVRRLCSDFSFCSTRVCR